MTIASWVLLVSVLLFVYTWVLYPVGVAAISTMRPSQRRARIGSYPTVSVVVATRGAVAEIDARVKDLADARYSGEIQEIIVSLDARGDVKQAMLSNTGVPVSVVLGDPEGGKAAALNSGVRAARGDVLVFADIGQRFAPTAIQSLIDALVADDRLGAVSGSLSIERKNASSRRTLVDLYWRYERWLREREARLHSSIGVTGAIYAMWKSDWAPLPPGVILDDLYTPMRLILAGRRVGFQPLAVATDSRGHMSSAEYHRKVRTLTGVLQLCVWMRSVLNPLRNPVWLQFVSHKLMRLVTPYLLLLGVAAAATVLLAMVSATQRVYLVATTLLLVVGMLAISKTARALASEFGLMQVAILRATHNGLRGNWDVWRRT